MIVDKVHEISSFEQSKWLKKNIIFTTQKRNQALKVFEKRLFYVSQKWENNGEGKKKIKK